MDSLIYEGHLQFSCQYKAQQSLPIVSRPGEHHISNAQKCMSVRTGHVRCQNVLCAAGVCIL